MADWTIEDVAARFAEAADTGRRLPRVRVQGYFNVWPELARDAWEAYPEETPEYRPLPPSPHAIERMLETMRWVQWLEVEQRHLVWMRAQRWGGGTSLAAAALHTDGAASLAAGDPDRGRSPQRSEGHGVVRGPSISAGVSGLARKPAGSCGLPRLDGGVASRAVLAYSNGYGWERCGSTDILLLGRMDDAPAPMPFPQLC
jgi:hypothetical protein